MKYYIGIDASTVATGICVLSEDDRILLLEVIKPPSKLKLLIDKKKFIYERLNEILINYKSAEVILEDIYRGPSYTTFKVLANLQGAIELLTLQNNLPLRKMKTTTMKSHIIKTYMKLPNTINNLALTKDRKELQRIVLIDYYGLPKDVSNDITDSLGLAICGKDGIFDKVKTKKRNKK